MTKKYIIPFLLISALIFHSCADDPSSVGLELLEQDFLRIDTVTSTDNNLAQTSSYFKKVVSLGNSSTLLVGKSNGLTAHTLMNFAFLLPDSIKTEFQQDNLIIESAKIEMFRNYYFPAQDSLAQFSLEAFEIMSNWGASTFSADSFSNLQYGATDIATDKNYGDSVYSFNVSTDVVRKWIDYSMNPDSLTNYGILISPGADAQKIAGFYGFDPFSNIETKLSVIVTKQGAYTDTLTGLVASDISAVLGEIPAADPDYMLIQSSLTINSKLYFDLTQLPENIVINKATLVLRSDTTKSLFGTSFQNSLIALLLSDSTKNEVNTDLFVRLTVEEDRYTGDLSPMIRKWVRDGDNQGILLRSGSEQVGAELFYLYGSQSGDVLKRPYLEIVYSYNR